MSRPDASFYKSGGTLAPDEPSYVYRAADNELYNHLRDGQFCYVLTSRQMGKSSLMNQTATRLHRENVVVAELDLTSIGQNLTLEQWYDGLVYELGRRLNLKPQLKAVWQANEHLGPLHRFLAVLRDGVLAHFFQPVVVFIDEIEVVRSLPFSTDEFFAAIRECYNRRASDPEMRRLTFSLFGMATPQDLIKDTRITPFNIGKRIELTDFTYDEAFPLTRGMGDDGKRDSARLLKRVLYWTSGQPYLTQRLCQSISENKAIVSDSDIDKLCNELFLTERARQSEANLVPLREYLLRSSADRAGLLDLYKKILTGRRVAIDPTDRQLSILQLSGVTRAISSRLRVRNRIYGRVFDKTWIRANMPDAELQRQRTAARRAFGQASLIYGVIIAITLWLGYLAYTGQVSASRSLKQVQQVLNLKGQLLYVADINLASGDLNNHDVPQTLDLLNAHSSDLMRGFEYGYLWRQCHRDYFTCMGDDSYIYSVSFSSDARYLATASLHALRIWDRVQKRQVAALTNPKGLFHTVRFSPDGSTLAYSDGSSITVVKAGKILGSNAWKPEVDLPSATAQITQIAFSPDGQFLAAGRTDGATVVYSTKSWQLARTLGGNSGATYAICFDPLNNNIIATAGLNAVVSIWDVTNGARLKSLGGHSDTVRALSFNASGTLLAAGSEDKTITIYDCKKWTFQHTLYSGNQFVNSVAFLSDKELVSAGTDTAIDFWDIDSQTVRYTLEGHTEPVQDLSLSADGRWLASASWDQTAKIWDTSERRSNAIRLAPVGNQLVHWTLSPGADRVSATTSTGHLVTYDVVNGAILNTALSAASVLKDARFDVTRSQIAIADAAGKVAVYDGSTRQELWEVNYSGQPRSIALSADGTLLAAGTGTGDVVVWHSPGRLVLHWYNGTRDPVAALHFSIDDKELAVGSPKMVHVIYPNHPSTTLTIAGDGAAVNFSPDCKTLVAGHQDGSVSLWNLATQRSLLTLDGGEQAIVSVAFSPDGRILRMVSEDGVTRAWIAHS